MYKILLGQFRTVFLLPKARTKSGWLEVDQELDNGWPTFDTNISVRRFLMVPPRGFLFLRFCGDCALKCENCVLCRILKLRLVKQHLLRQWTLNDAKCR